MTTTELSPGARGAILLGLARHALAQALGQASELVGGAAPAGWLRDPGATFVTLTQRGRLRGCIGSLEPYRPLHEDVQANAVAAALRDPRFTPLAAHELDGTGIGVSLLSPTEPLRFGDEAEALAQLRPGVDGVVFEWRERRSTFLPQVWEQLPAPGDFMAQLRRKAGLAPGFWSAEVRLLRYTVTQWKETDLPQGEGV